MVRIVINNIIRFVFLVLFQAIVLNHIGLFNMVNPYLYVLFILLMPLNTPLYLLLCTSFLLGLTIDSFSSTGGIHAAASVFMAFCRPLILLLTTSKGGLDHQSTPNLHTMGIQRFFTYTTILVFLHHLALFNIEIFRFSEFHITLLRTIFSSIFTVFLIILSQYLTNSIKKR